MTWFSLPVTQPENAADFSDSATATAWLAQQPQANAAAMQAALTRQIQALNKYSMAARERFKTLEALRTTLFAVDGESQRRFENRPLPLWSSEQATQDVSRRLWRNCATGYLHCLRACLDGEPGVVELKAIIAHRALTCLRMEQQTCYLGALDMAPDFWNTLHSILASAEQMGVAREQVSDRLLGETTESSFNGQYAMILLLHLARPFELSRSQFAAATRWLARWREQIDITSAPDDNPRSRMITLDLSLDRPFPLAGVTPANPRWFSIGGVLRKIRKRIESLDAGESPESLKLGGSISSEACRTLLKTLSENLRASLPSVPDILVGLPPVDVAHGLENIHRQLGGKSLKQAEEITSMNRREQEQIAIFGQIGRAVEDKNAAKPEKWMQVQVSASVALQPASTSAGTTKDRDQLHLFRPAGSAQTRLLNRCLLAIQLPAQPRFSLASVFSLCMRSDGSLHAIARVLPGEPAPVVADVSERPMGKISRQPAFLLPADNTSGIPESLILPAGIAARALSIKLHHERTPAIALLSCLEHGSDFERWTYKTN